MCEDTDEHSNERNHASEHVKYLSGIIKESQAEYSRQLLSLSSAALGLSAAFYKNLSSPGTATWFPMLYTAWMLFIATIVSTLIAIQLSIKAHKDYRSELREWIANPSYVVASGSHIDELMPKLVWFSTVAFLVGVMSIFMFTAYNIQRERTMSKLVDPCDSPKPATDVDSIPVGDHVEVDRIPTPHTRPAEPPKTPPEPPKKN